mmetsp:Transcript_65950/g.197034  ORF Transcript_65950/g.197034 Transcript_65950/m.197034 type:complete len:204 (+) Transcript_65950:1-612(+)
MGSVPKFGRVAAALQALLTARLCAENAPLFHDALRTAVGNGKGPKLGKLRPPFCSLFDAAAARLDAFPPPLAADVALWTLVATTHGRLTKPERALNAADAAAPLAQLTDALRRLAHGGGGDADGGSGGGGGAAKVGGSLRPLALTQLYEVLEVLNALWKREAWVRPRLQEALALAQQLGDECWSKEQLGAITRWLSTVRARTT